MAEEMRMNRPVYQQGQRPEGMGMPEPTGSGRRGGKMSWIVLAVVIVVLVVLGVLFRDKIMPKKDNAANGYQAVFLTNGQVYFGKMSQNRHDEYLTLTDIFYLQVTQPPLQGSQQTGQQAAAAQAQPQLSLVKLGNELHGPEDVMKINRSQVLFFEDMKADGKVVQAIQEYKKNPNPGAATPTPAPAAPAPTPTPPANK